MSIKYLPSEKVLKAALKKRKAMIELAKVSPVFQPLMKPARYKGVWGGRGSGKSHVFAQMVVEACLRNQGFRVVCIREVQKSIALSVRQLIIDKINE